MSRSPLAKKSLGQHWLSDIATLEMIVASAELTPKDMVLEIGPGLGSLTEQLLRHAGRVVAVELDKTLAMQLPGRVPASNLEVVQANILGYDLSLLPPDYKIVANIPYYLTSNLIRTLSEALNPPSIAVLLVQKEVARRVCAAPGAMSLLSVTAQFYWQVELGELVPAHLFTPPPKVDSQVLILRRRPEPPFKDIDTKAFFRLVRIGFAQRRKTLGNTLHSGLRLPKEKVSELLTKAGLDPAKRPQSLNLEEWHILYKQLSQFMP